MTGFPRAGILAAVTDLAYETHGMARATALSPADSSAADALAEAISSLEAELDHLFGRLEPVLRPSVPTIDVLTDGAERPLSSPLRDQVERIRYLRARLTGIHQRLDL